MSVANDEEVDTSSLQVCVVAFVADQGRIVVTLSRGYKNARPQGDTVPLFNGRDHQRLCEWWS